MQTYLDDYSTAAEVAMDLANTGPEVWHGVDRLGDLSGLKGFLGAHSVVSVLGTASLRTKELPAVHRLRDDVRELIEQPDRDCLIRGAERLTAAVGRLTVSFDDDGRARWVAVADEAGSPAEALALVCGLGILGVVHTLGPARFRRCSAPTCAGVFIDTSRPGRRRYCMPERCGNRVNVANHRARQSGA